MARPASFSSTLHLTFVTSVLLTLAVGLIPAEPVHALTPLQDCVKFTGKTGTKCLIKGGKILSEQVEPPEGILGSIAAPTAIVGDVYRKCSAEDTRTLGFRDAIDVADQLGEGCALFVYEMNGLVYTADQAGLTEDQQACRLQMYKWMTKVSKIVALAWGKKCTLKEYLGKGCDRAKRDRKVTKTRAKAETVLGKKCGADFDVVNTFEGATLQDRIATFADIAVKRGKHWAQRVYPPNDVGPTGELGAFAVGLTTLALEDPARLSVPGTGPRPVVTEVYYPVLEADTVGLSEDVVELLGFTLFSVPAFRDAPIAPAGPYPVVLFSHGNLGTRIQSFFFGSVLASHGFIVLSADHHGNTFTEGVTDPDSAANRPLDMSFLIDEATFINGDVGNFFEGAFDLSKIGMSGHSFGGYTSFALAGGTFALGTFTDSRIKAIFPQAPAAGFFDASFFATITIPTLIVGGTIDETTPFDTDQQFPFDNMLSGAAVVGLAELKEAGHFTFSSFCEVPSTLLEFLGGFEEACEPRHIPWRHAQDLTMYLAQNFFDATLNGNAAALANLDSLVIAGFEAEDIVYQSK